MKTFLILFGFIMCAAGVFAQEWLTAGVRNKSSQPMSSPERLDTATASILKDWFKPVEQPDKNFLNKEFPLASKFFF